MYCFKQNDTFGFSTEKNNLWDSFKEITNEEYILLFEGQSKRKIIKFKEHATPYLVDSEKVKTEEELYNEGRLSQEEYNLYIDKLRQKAYAREADPLGLQVLRGDIEKSVWLEKIEEIKKHYPKIK